MADYIDRHLTIQVIKEHIGIVKAKLESTDVPSYISGAYIMALRHCMDLVSLIPAADTAEKRLGRWVYKKAEPVSPNFWRNPDKDITCSKCNVQAYWESSFCPNCGARMANPVGDLAWIGSEVE